MIEYLSRLLLFWPCLREHSEHLLFVGQGSNSEWTNPYPLPWDTGLFDLMTGSQPSIRPDKTFEKPHCPQASASSISLFPFSFLRVRSGSVFENPARLHLQPPLVPEYSPCMVGEVLAFSSWKTQSDTESDPKSTGKEQEVERERKRAKSASKTFSLANGIFIPGLLGGYRGSGHH